MKCPLCASLDVFLFHNSVWSMDQGKVYRCRHCDVTFIWPVFNDDEMMKFYKNYNEHVKARGVTPSGGAEEIHKKTRKIVKPRFERIKHYFENKNSVLEIGAATGAFLELLDGKQLYCVEPADENRAFSKQFVQDTYSDISEIPSGKTFDVICMFHVLEHIKEPVTFLKNCKSMLSPGGIIIIEVPHIEDPLLSLYNCEPFKDFYFMPMHVFIYSLKSLDFVLSSAGFSRKKELYYQRYGIENHVGWITGKQSTEIEACDLFCDYSGYMQFLEGMKKTDTIFYIAESREDGHAV